ncbi:MAG: DUF3791 domain-containing protein [Bacteroidales bacterium]|jgi:hypothetical protein|nr:DUF3791 domain-containing protein [Bacteroidales bacterium]
MKDQQQQRRRPSDKASFFASIVPKFAYDYKIGFRNAFLYLKKYGGWGFIKNNWWALHTDNPDNVVRELYEYCEQNGGNINLIE